MPLLVFNEVVCQQNDVLRDRYKDCFDSLVEYAHQVVSTVGLGLEIVNFNDQGDWDNTSIILTLTNFVNTDSPDNFGSTQLPFAGSEGWNLGVQHRQMNPVEASFLIKTGTLLLAVVTLGIAMASTPYWDPFRNFFKGALE